MTHEELGAVIVGILVLVGLAGLGMVGLLKKLGITIGKKECANSIDGCPDPSCQSFVKETRDNAKLARDNAALAANAVLKAKESIIKLQEGQNNVTKILDQKRIKIEGLQNDTTEIKTDVKWIVRELQKKNDT
jgi:hypothetical protein